MLEQEKSNRSRKTIKDRVWQILFKKENLTPALVAELVYAYASGAYPVRVGGSNPLEGTALSDNRVQVVGKPA